MPTTVLSIGPAHNILQNVVYALPAKQVIVTTGAACETSVDGTNWTALTSGSKTGAKFLRCPSGNTTVTCSAAGENPSGWNSGYISIGSDPSLDGAIRLTGNTALIRVRHTNDNDYTVVGMGPSGIELGANGMPTIINSTTNRFGINSGATFVEVGQNAAQSGAIRLPNNVEIKSRNVGNTTDIRVIMLASDNRLHMGDNSVGTNIHGGPLSVDDSVAIGTTPAQSGALRLANGQSIKYRNSGNTADVDVMNLDSGNNLSFALSGVGAVGFGGARTNHNKELYLTQKIANPGTPGANGAFIWLQDNGSGKAQLMVRFATGAAIQLAIEP